MADSSEITDIIKAKIKGFQGGAESVDVGTVVEIGDGIARVYGLASCMASEPVRATSTDAVQRVARGAVSNPAVKAAAIQSPRQ